MLDRAAVAEIDCMLKACAKACALTRGLLFPNENHPRLLRLPIPAEQRTALLGVVKPELCDLQISPSETVNHPVLIRDSARPESRQGMLQGFGLTDPVVMAADRIFDQFIDTTDHFFVRLQPVLVILPSQRRENEVHASAKSLRLFLTVFPAFRLSIEAINRLALAGERRR